MVLAINGEDVSGYSLAAIKGLTIGQEGTSVTLSMQRPGAGEYAATLQRRIPAFVDYANAEAADVLVDQ